MALPLLFAGGAALGAATIVASKLLNPPTKEELQRKKMEADTLFVVQPKTFLQRTATGVVNSLFF